jgi:hypothetical protein
MKKTILSVLVFITIAIAIILYKNEIILKRTISPTLLAGEKAINFLLGIKDSTYYELNNFMDKFIVILAFSDETPMSFKTENLLEDFVKNYLFKRKDVLLFNIKKQGNFVVIQEKTNLLNLKYRTLFKKIPSAYHFKTYPTLLIIDRYGIIKILYSGYSPTLIKDLFQSLELIK